MSPTPAQTAFDPIQQAADNITYWAYQGGFRGSALTRIVAYGLAESGGNPTAHNNNPATGDDSYGLWQINYYGALRQPRSQRYGDPTTLYDPVANAKAAYDLSGGGINFGPWKSDDLNGRYQKFLPYAQRATSGVGGTMPGTPPSSPGGTTPGYTTTPTSDNSNPCLLSLPSVGPLGGGCIFHESQGRAVLGALILASGVVVAGLGIILLTGRSITGVTQYVPGPVGLVSGGVNKLNEYRDTRKVNALQKTAPSDSIAFKREAREAKRRQSYSMDDLANPDIQFG